MTRVCLLLAAAVLLAPRAALACPVCFQNADSPLLDSARLGVGVMVGVTVCVLGTFAGWFVRLRRLQRRHAEEHPS